jgi:NADH dehydrogenase/NADH:ubiquinone oxidoreductase subunit G
MVKITIDGRVIEVKEGTRVLDAARSLNINIPTLCEHESVSPAGTCRLCLVETTNKEGRNRVTPSCIANVEEGLVVSTDSEKVVAERKTAMQKLMARAPKSATVKELAKKLGAESTPFLPEDHHNCVLCGLCMRVCQEVVGVAAISKINRSTEPGAVPFTVSSENCIACGSCVYICPTDAISLVDKGDTRTITWPYEEKKFKMVKCKACGTYFMPEKQQDYMMQKSGRTAEFFDKCMDCRD